MKRVVLAGIVLLGAEAARAQSCPAVLPGAGVPQTAVTPVTLHVLQDEIEPVPATDGLVHLAFAAQVTNVGRNRAALTSVVPVDPLAGFAPTGVNRVFDVNGNAIEGMVRLFDPATQTGARTAKQVDFKAMEGGTSGTMFFDVGYASVTDVPRLLAVALTATLAGRVWAVGGPAPPQTRGAVTGAHGGVPRRWPARGP